MINGKAQRLQQFLNWCVERARVFTKPMTKGFLSKEYVRLNNLPLIPYYFSVNYTDAYLASGIKVSNHSLEDKAKLMCLFSLPVDADFFEVLVQFANIELDDFMRITHYEHGTTLFGGTHKKPRAEKQKRKPSGEANVDGGLEEDDDIIVDDEDLDEIEVLDSSTFKTPSNRTPNQTAEETIHKLFNNVSSTSQWMGADSSSSRPQPSSSEYGSRQQTPSNQNWTDLLGIQTQNQEVPKELTPNSTTNKTDSTPGLMEVIQKLELFFLYKCRQDLMPLCLRIKEVKENEAKFSQKNIKSSTIKSFFEVSLRLMVARNVTDLVKLEHSTRDFKIGVNEFLEDLKAQNMVEGLEEVIESIQSEVANRETISYQTICFTFLDIVNNLAQIC